jgi:hypothetical protein
MPKEDTQFKPGCEGGPGRPKGSRDKLSYAFIEALNTTFEELTDKDKPAGIEALRELRDNQPAQYANVIGKLMPKLMELSGPDGEAIPVSGTVNFRKVDATTDE